MGVRMWTNKLEPRGRIRCSSAWPCNPSGDRRLRPFGASGTKAAPTKFKPAMKNLLWAVSARDVRGAIAAGARPSGRVHCRRGRSSIGSLSIWQLVVGCRGGRGARNDAGAPARKAAAARRAGDRMRACARFPHSYLFSSPWRLPLTPVAAARHRRDAATDGDGALVVASGAGVGGAAGGRGGNVSGGAGGGAAGSAGHCRCWQ